MEAFFIVGFFCIGPLILFSFGVWIGKGAPGWPWKVVRRDDEDEFEGYQEGEAYPSRYLNKRQTG